MPADGKYFVSSFHMAIASLEGLNRQSDPSNSGMVMGVFRRVLPVPGRGDRASKSSPNWYPDAGVVGAVLETSVQELGVKLGVVGALSWGEGGWGEPESSLSKRSSKIS